MKATDVLIIGGGPAGSSCAWQLKRNNIDSIILDAQDFPRTKLCAGWITPQVVQDLDLTISDYPHRFLTFEGIRVHIYGLSIRLNTVQHSIRRYEFDDWLLKRSGAEVVKHNVRNIRRENGHYIVDELFHCKYLVGAGGTKCPVYRNFFRETNPRAKTLQAVTLEQEFPFDWEVEDCHLWFFDKGLPGYSWYVPKANGYINVGVGGMAKKLKQRNDDIKTQWQHFTHVLDKKSFIRNYDYKPTGYSYFLRGGIDIGFRDNAYIIGDAAGLATRDLCEGIGAAVRSGILAADSIIGKQAYDLATVSAHSADSGMVQKLMEYMFINRRH